MRDYSYSIYLSKTNRRISLHPLLWFSPRQPHSYSYLKITRCLFSFFIGIFTLLISMAQHFSYTPFNVFFPIPLHVPGDKVQKNEGLLSPQVSVYCGNSYINQLKRSFPCCSPKSTTSNVRPFHQHITFLFVSIPYFFLSIFTVSVLFVNRIFLNQP